MVSRSPTPWLARSMAPSAVHQSGSMVEAAETLRLALSFGDGDQLGERELEHAVVDQPHQAEPLGQRHDVAHRQQAAVRPAARASGIRRMPAARDPIATTGS